MTTLSQQSQQRPQQKQDHDMVTASFSVVLTQGEVAITAKKQKKNGTYQSWL